jgi:hypothetical protein
MGSGVIRLYRSPLREGEPLYTLSEIDQGFFDSGERKGERRPKKQNLLPQVEEDGRLVWTMLDSEENRAYCTAFLPTTENPSAVYSFELDEEERAEEGADPDLVSAEPLEKKRGPGRPKKAVDA